MMGTTIVAPKNEIEVVVPEELRYDPNPMWNGGVTRPEVGRKVRDSRAMLGGTTHNCAGRPTPWGEVDHLRKLSQPPPGPVPGLVSMRNGSTSSRSTPSTQLLKRRYPSLPRAAANSRRSRGSTAF